MALSDYWLKAGVPPGCRFLGLGDDFKVLFTSSREPLPPDLRSLRLVGRWRRERQERNERRAKRHASKA